MTDARLRHKIDETRAIADQRGLDLVDSPLLATFEIPLWGVALATAEISELAKTPSTAVGVMSPDPLPEVRRQVDPALNLHIIAERGLVAALSGGATVQVYPSSNLEMQALAVALFAGIAPDGLRVSMAPYVSSGRQQATLESSDKEPVLGARELLNAVRRCDGGTAAFAGEAEEAIVVDDLPAELEALRATLAGELCGRSVRVTRMPSGRFLVTPDARARDVVGNEHLRVIAQQIAMSSDRFVEARGMSSFGFVTEPVARWRYGPEVGARVLAAQLFGRPDTVQTHLGLHPFAAEGTLFFCYEGSETVWEAANKGISYVTVRDVHEYGRILHAIRLGG